MCGRGYWQQEAPQNRVLVTPAGSLKKANQGLGLLHNGATRVPTDGQGCVNELPPGCYWRWETERLRVPDVRPALVDVHMSAPLVSDWHTDYTLSTRRR